MQDKINQIQDLYRQWQQLQPKLAQAQQDWQQSCAIMQQLNDFYFDGEYREFYEAIENGAKVDLTTQGEYSVMSEDALWNAFHEHQHMAWQRLRSAMAELDPEQ
ncbi:DUF4298 domain-containing protein [Alysiella filiformis]|uniref:DUF4298 domain-containing protein n=1 Tax=Alysiella filiformis DSM 16848 TaxID=1120981 RepID=A0A286ED16_9NEIS|nr:DUF4298 domain-containing protein [Alysiella filiformis]QMT31927.1 DUF4298 domain-containing protein [Alysiella filiformis]UBQ57166.1 DUF4298 domain-containing protein [Alysiella filiformis DSM 16848]SOD68778.1 protein of unknown function [Alysiella filiformis DSM 16848]